MQRETVDWTDPTRPQIRKSVPVPETRTGALDLLSSVAWGRDRETLVGVFDGAGGDVRAGLEAVQGVVRQWHAGGHVPPAR